MSETKERQYKLPNGCILTPGGRIRIPSEQLALIPEEDWEKFNLDLIEGDQSPYSEVVTMLEADNQMTEEATTTLKLCIERQGDGSIFLVAFDPLTRDTINGQDAVVASVLTKKREHAATIVKAVNAYSPEREAAFEALIKAAREIPAQEKTCSICRVLDRGDRFYAKHTTICWYGNILEALALADKVKQQS